MLNTARIAINILYITVDVLSEYYHFSFKYAISKGFITHLMGFNSKAHLRFYNGNQWENRIDLIESLCAANFADSDHSFKWEIPIPQVPNDEFLCVW